MSDNPAKDLRIREDIQAIDFKISGLLLERLHLEMKLGEEVIKPWEKKENK